MQRFDVFFKRVFSQHANDILMMLNHILPVDCGTKVSSEPSVEVVKGALRIDKIFKTDTGRLLIMDFEEPFTLDSYFEILTHTAAHIHSTKLHREIVKSSSTSTNYVPLIISITASKRHLEFIMTQNIATRIKLGVYQIVATPFFPIFLLVFSEMNLAEHMLRIANLCSSDDECKELGEKLKSPELWEDVLKRENNIELRRAMYSLVSKYGELLFLLNPDAKYLLQVWRFSKTEAQHVAKDILNAILILFSKEVMQMSVSEILTKKEKREIIKAMGVKEAIEAVGIEEAIEAVGIEKVIETVGIEKVIRTVGIEKVIETVGVKEAIDALGRILNLSEEEKEQLLKKYKK